MSDSISFILPIFNEEDNIEEVALSALDLFMSKRYIFELILVNDGSTDQTKILIENLAKNNKYIRVINHPTNRGYGSALISGIRVARYETVGFMDSDGQFDISEIERLLPYSKDYDVVAGYRVKRRDPWYRVLMGASYTRLICALFGIHVRDINCGFKIFKGSRLKEINLFSRGLIIDGEILVKMKNRGCSLKEVGLTHFPRLKGQSSGADRKWIIKGFGELRNLFTEIKGKKQ